jgi:5-methylcytosine-specific restriction endonuclease McrA
MSHANPSRDLGVVIERAVDLLLADLGRKRLARTKRAVRETEETGSPARITNSTRRRVFERDGLQCTYESPDGRRCDARAFLELDHAEPRALGGASDVSNLRVRCRAHNQLAAEEVFGREHVHQCRHFRQRKWMPFEAGGGETPQGQSHDNAPPNIFEKVRLALTKMGFRDGEARHALEEVQRRHGEMQPVEQVLREALLVATAKCA